jgi:LPS-assembly protein
MPHYEIEGDSIVVRPGRRIIFRRTRIKILGYTVLRLPFLSIPLNSRTYRNMPYVGESPDEGYFVKARLGVPLKNPNYNLDTREEYMTKLGLGLGGDYQYVAHNSAGVVSLYHIFGSSDDLTFSNTHHQVFPWGSLSISSDYEKDNYLVAPNSTLFNTKVGLVIPEGKSGSDRVSFSDSQSSSNGYTTSSSSVGVTDQRNFGKRTSTQVDLNYFTTGSQTTSTDTTSERLDVHVEAQEDLKAAQAAIEYQRSIPIGSTPSYIGESDETPVISLTSDAKRLFGNKVSQEFPFKTLLSWGDFEQASTGSPISRAFFDFNFNKLDSSKSRFRLDYSGDFKQGVYSDDTAEYVLAMGTNMRYDLGQNTGLNLRYNYLRPYGYSPLSLDQTGSTNYVSSDLNVRPVKPWLIGAQTGYDLLRVHEHEVGWQPVGLRSDYQPEKWFLFRFQTTYQTFQHEWENLQFDLTYLPGATKVSLGSTYDGVGKKWSSVNMYVDNLKWGRAHFGTAISYNGYLNQVESEQFSVIYDLHCADAIFQLQETNSGFRPGRTISFFIRLKAIPYDVPLGVGTRGQPIGFNTTGTQF